MADTVIVLVMTGVLALFWMLLSRANSDDRETIVGVQRHGRTYFVRRDHLDRWNDNDRQDAFQVFPALPLAIGLLVVGTLALLSLTRLA